MLYSVPIRFTGFYLVLTEVLLGLTGFYWVLPGFTGFYWVLLGFTGFYWVLPVFTVFYWVLRADADDFLVFFLSLSLSLSNPYLVFFLPSFIHFR